MSILETVLQRIQLLPVDKQRTVLDFIDFLVHGLQLDRPSRTDNVESKADDIFVPRSPLGQKLYSLRQRAMSEGMQPTSIEEINTEISDHRRHHLFYEDVS